MNKQTYVLGFVFDAASSQVLLMLKNRPDWQKGNYNGIGGKIEEGEDPIEAMVRECKEESNLDIPERDWTHYATINGEGYEMFVYTTRLTDITDAETMTDEVLSIHPYPEILVGPAPILPNLSWLLPMARDHEGTVVDITL